MLSLLKRNNRISKSEFEKQKDNLRRYLGNYGLSVGFDGYFRYQTAKEKRPGSIFPLVIGFDEQGKKELKQGIVNGVSVCPACISDKRYYGEKIQHVIGEIEQNRIDLNVKNEFRSLEELMNYREAYFRELDLIPEKSPLLPRVISSGFSRWKYKKIPEDFRKNKPGTFHYLNHAGRLEKKGIFNIEKICA